MKNIEQKIALIFYAILCSRAEKIRSVASSCLAELNAPSGQLSGSPPSRLRAPGRCCVHGAQLVLPCVPCFLLQGIEELIPVTF